jgi:hypothetical protein
MRAMRSINGLSYLSRLNSKNAAPFKPVLARFVIASEAKQSRAAAPFWIASSRSLSSGRATSRGPVGSSQ